ncbi:Oxysterol-binding protein-related protein 2B [Camellia lanceoleosa]|uniref:Oxysterol-binding protein-related protein 2B n=1 Tax=Camellia lanceoleosa TaxID=1840588 RepID=A0ACC0GZ03_9ERIC|nr:Oxysterol-binding protein-related protein 2B [Camellia lanceoleosa]
MDENLIEVPVDYALLWLLDSAAFKVTTPICNLILGKMYLNHHGTMHICGIRQYSCELKFKEPSILDRNPQ